MKSLEKGYIIKKTGKEWCFDYGIVISSPDGWFSVEDFEKEEISKSEFLNRASQSKIKSLTEISRRAASNFRNDLFKK